MQSFVIICTCWPLVKKHSNAIILQIAYESCCLQMTDLVKSNHLDELSVVRDGRRRETPHSLFFSGSMEVNKLSRPDPCYHSLSRQELTIFVNGKWPQ